MTIRGYIRVSTEEQAAEGVSLAAQRRMLQERGADVIYEDAGVSSRIPLEKRPAGCRLVADLVTGDVVITCKLDRFFRSTVECLTRVPGWTSAGIDVVMLDVGLDTKTPMGKAVLSIMATLAQLTRDQISENTKMGLAQVKAEGRPTGRAPFGFRYTEEDVGPSKILEPDPSEQAVIARARALRSEGLTLRAIASQLEVEGVRSRRGGLFAASQVRSMLMEEST